MMKFDSRSADTFWQVDLVVNKPGIPKIALLSPRLKLRLVAGGAAALLAFAVGLLVAVFGALADEPARPRPAAERAGNPASWEARLSTAKDLERKADHLEKVAARGQVSSRNGAVEQHRVN